MGTSGRHTAVKRPVPKGRPVQWTARKGLSANKKDVPLSGSPDKGQKHGLPDTFPPQKAVHVSPQGVRRGTVREKCPGTLLCQLSRPNRGAVLGQCPGTLLKRPGTPGGAIYSPRCPGTMGRIQERGGTVSRGRPAPSRRAPFVPARGRLRPSDVIRIARMAGSLGQMIHWSSLACTGTG
jgi:hypothetical protein